MCILTYVRTSTCLCIAYDHFVILLQIEPELRKQWDKFVLNMNIIDRDPQTGSEVLHWTAKLPVSGVV